MVKTWSGVLQFYLQLNLEEARKAASIRLLPVLVYLLFGVFEDLAGACNLSH